MSIAIPIILAVMLACLNVHVCERQLRSIGIKREDMSDNMLSLSLYLLSAMLGFAEAAAIYLFGVYLMS